MTNWSISMGIPDGLGPGDDELVDKYGESWAAYFLPDIRII